MKHTKSLFPLVLLFRTWLKYVFQFCKMKNYYVIEVQTTRSYDKSCESAVAMSILVK